MYNINNWKIDGRKYTITSENVTDCITVIYNAKSILWLENYKTYTPEEALTIITEQVAHIANSYRRDIKEMRAQAYKKAQEMEALEHRAAELELGATVIKEVEYPITKEEARAILSPFDNTTTLPYKRDEQGRREISRVLYNLLKAARYSTDTIAELFGASQAELVGYGIKTFDLYSANGKYFVEWECYSSCD